MHDFTFWQVLAHFDIWTVAMCMTISLMCLTFKEPVLALKLSEHNVSVTQTGLVFSLDTITYTIASACLNFVKEEKNGKKYGRLQYFGTLFFTVSMLLQGPVNFMQE